jgi:Spy/CpxP family protein refolding chaperone
MKRFACWAVVFALIWTASPFAWGQTSVEKPSAEKASDEKPATDKPAGERPRGERGRGGFGQGLLALVSQKSVQEELKLTDDQVKSIAPLAEKQRESFRGMRDATAEERQKRQEQGTANEKALTELLQPEQLKRLKQISLQQQGVVAAARPEMAESLKLTSEQQEKIRAIQQGARDKMQEVMRDGNREEARGKLAALRESTNEKALAVLTEEQQTKWKELTGEKFTGEIRFGGNGPRRPGAAR